MLLKFTTIDMFNTSLINVASGERAYDIVTVPVAGKPEKVASSQEPLSSSQTAAASRDFSPIKEYPTLSEEKEDGVTRRQTQIKDASGHVVVDVHWEGRHPHITIDGTEVGGLNDLFGTSSVRFM